MAAQKTELYLYTGLMYALDEAQLPTEGPTFARTRKVAGTHIVRIGEDLRFTGLSGQNSWADLSHIDPTYRQEIERLKKSDPTAVDSANLIITWDSEMARWVALTSDSSSVLELPVKGFEAEARRQTIGVLNDLLDDNVIYAYEALTNA